MRVTVHFDGGGKNPGLSACGAVVYDQEGQVLAEWGNVIGEGTNNIAEYEGLLLGLRIAHTLEATHVDVRGDSQLVVRQVSREWRAKDRTMRGYCDKARAALAQFGGYTIAWVPREENADADAQVRKALGVPDKPKRTDWKGAGLALAKAVDHWFDTPGPMATGILVDALDAFRETTA